MLQAPTAASSETWCSGPRVSTDAGNFTVGIEGSGWLGLALIAAAVLAWRRGRSALRPALGAAFVVALPVVYGFWRAATLPLQVTARVAVVQPNIPEDLKMDRARALDSSLVALAQLTRRIPPGSVDLVVWPEVSLQALIAAPGAQQLALRERVRELAHEVRSPILVGGYGYDFPAGRAKPLYYNAAFLMTPTGLAPTEYDKHYLVPIVERVPFIDPAWLEGITGPMEWFGGLSRGRRTDLFPAGAARFGALICYESIFAPLSRLYRKEGADFLVNMTNDSWYGREPFWARTSALWQHPAHMVMRAIENRVGVARAANTGISMFIDPLGRKSQETPLFAPAVRIATVYTTRGSTLFSRWGDWLAELAVLGTIGLLLFCRFAVPRGS